MKTFLILLAIVFTSSVWFIIRAIRYTDETVGADSPLYKERTYQFSAYDYFGQFTKALLAFLLIQMILIVFLITKVAIYQQPLLFIFVLFFSAFIGFLIFVFYFDWRYWTITRNALITLNPFQPSITVDGRTHHSIFTPDNVVCIELHLKKTNNSKDPLGGYGYYLFYGTDSQTTQVNNIFFSHIGHIEFLGRFFSNVPQVIVWHRLPWITNYDHIEESK